jgi:hypothetical protein
MAEAPEELKRVCQELADQGIWPPYSLIVNDGAGGQVKLDVTMTSFIPSEAIPPHCDACDCWGPGSCDYDYDPEDI